MAGATVAAFPTPARSIPRDERGREASSPDRSVDSASERRAIFVAIALGTFITSLDGSGVSTALPVIGRGLSTDAGSLAWVATGYLLVICALSCAAGSLADALGHTRVYLAGLSTFVTGSACCAAAPTVGMLIGLRACQAVGAALILATSPAILALTFPATHRGRVLGAQVMANYVGLAVGPAVSMCLTTVFGWRAVFWMTVPLGLLAIGLTVRRMPAVHRSARAPVGVGGGLSLGLGLVVLLIVVTHALSRGFTLWSPNVALASVGILVLTFAYIAVGGAAPVLGSVLVGRAASAMVVASLVISYVWLSSVTFALPFYLMGVRGLSAAATGTLMSTRAAITATVAPISGAICDRIGPWIVGGLGFITLAGGALILARLQAESPLGYVVWGIGLVGSGMGLFLSPNHSALLGSAARQKQGRASGLLGAARATGMTLGVSVGRVMLIPFSAGAR